MKTKENPKENVNHILTMLSHDIKSPLTGILGISDLLIEEVFSQEHKDMAKHIHKAAKDVLTLVNNMLFMAKLQAGKEIPDFTWVRDIDQEFKHLIQTFALEARSKNIRLELIMEEALLPVYWDVAKLRLHVFNNIISNALKFTPQGGFIEIHVFRISDNIRVIIQDSGPGIPRGLKDKIFLPYISSDEKMGKRFQEGLGLGLYNAKKFVEYHGGQIAVEDQEESEVLKTYTNPENEYNKGARFVIDIPIFPEKILSYRSNEKKEDLLGNVDKVDNVYLEKKKPSRLNFDYPNIRILTGTLGEFFDAKLWTDVYSLTERYTLFSSGAFFPKSDWKSIGINGFLQLIHGIGLGATDRTVLHSSKVPQVEEIAKLLNDTMSDTGDDFDIYCIGILDCFKNQIHYLTNDKQPAILWANNQAVMLRNAETAKSPPPPKAEQNVDQKAKQTGKFKNKLSTVESHEFNNGDVLFFPAEFLTVQSSVPRNETNETKENGLEAVWLEKFSKEISGSKEPVNAKYILDAFFEKRRTEIPAKNFKGISAIALENI